jgi:hypothetical protein
MADPSWFGSAVDCAAERHYDDEPLDGAWYKPCRAVQISPAGRSPSAAPGTPAMPA